MRNLRFVTALFALTACYDERYSIPSLNPDDPSIPSNNDDGNFGEPPAGDALDDTCNGVDEDGDGVDGNDSPFRSSPCGGEDADRDGYFTTYTDELGGIHPYDCVDNNPAINPGAAEICDGVDQDCYGGIDDKDSDLDGYVDMVCASTYTGSKPDTDCLDSNANVRPGVAEVPNNQLDDDCSASTPDNGVAGQEDLDCDGALSGLDCNDNNRSLNVQDNDRDTYSTCENDCNDSASTGADTYPNAGEREPSSPALCRTDRDRDGFGAMTGFASGAVAGTDCDDGDARRFPGNPEVAGNGIDEDCNAATGDGGSGVPGNCAADASVTTGTFTAPAGATNLVISGSSIGSTNDFNWVTWQDGTPANMDITVNANVITFTHNVCRGDAAVWTANVQYRDAGGATRYACEGNNTMTGTWSVREDSTAETVTAVSNGMGGCNATW